MARQAGLRLAQLPEPHRSVDEIQVEPDPDSASPNGDASDNSTIDDAAAETEPDGVGDGDDDGDGQVPTQFFHQMLHELRTIELEKLHMDGGTALSIGASGSWYFDWFERSVGTLDTHIGVEAFEEKPDDLPSYVRWNTSTADRFEGVDEKSVDLVFAGQTTEHLWAVELADFLLESYRVLRPRGVLVLDSPNRLVTEDLLWSHGGHTVELSADEICELLTLAGFKVEKKTGILPTRLDGSVNPQLEAGMDNGAVVARRVRSGPEVLDDSFIWWVVASKTDAVPDRDELVAASERLFWQHWPTRIGRGMWDGPTPGTVLIPAGAEGVVASTLPFIFAAGDWTMGFCVEGDSTTLNNEFEVQMVDAAGTPVHVLPIDQATRSQARLTWNFTQEELAFATSIRIVGRRPVNDVVLSMPFDLHATSGVGVRAVV